MPMIQITWNIPHYSSSLCESMNSVGASVNFQKKLVMYLNRKIAILENVPELGYELGCHGNHLRQILSNSCHIMKV